MIAIAPDKFKGTLSALEVASLIAAAIRARNSRWQIVCLPIADGGEGTVDAAVRSGMRRIGVVVAGPLGEPLVATYACDDTTAVIEMSAAAGLNCLRGDPDEATASRSSTRGVGELVAHAVQHGARRVILGLGGSASTDGGAGMVLALGGIATDRFGEPVGPGGVGLGSVAFVDLAPVTQFFDGVEVILASDVNSPLCGVDGAARVFGPQKGAGPETVELLDRNLSVWADAVRDSTGRDVRSHPGAGAAGGTGFPLLACGSARLVSGAAVVAQLTSADIYLRDAEVLIIGEGSLDQQSLCGKGPVALARSASAKGATVLAVVGTNSLDADELASAGIDRAYAMTDIEPDVEVCMTDAAAVLSRLASAVANDLAQSDAVGFGAR